MKKKLDIKRLILLNIPYVFAFYFVDKIAAVFRQAPGTELIDKLTGGFANFGTAFANPLPSFHPVDLLIGVAAGALLKLAVYVKGKNRKKFRQGEEYGSARWDAYYLLKEVIYGHRRRKHYDPIQQDHRAVLPPFSR